MRKPDPTRGSRAALEQQREPAIAANGNTGTTNLGDLPPGYELISSLLQAYKASAADLGGYTPPTAPTPGPLPLLGALSALSWSGRLRRRLGR